MTAGERDDRPYAELTPQEQAERRRAAARKAAATRARKRREHEQAVRDRASGAAHLSPVTHAPSAPSQDSPATQGAPLAVPENHADSASAGDESHAAVEQPNVVRSHPDTAAPPTLEAASPAPQAPAPAVVQPSQPELPVAAEPGAAGPLVQASSIPAADPNAPAMDISGLCKKFGSVVAVDNVTLEVQQGQSFGIVGPNGAGKTTTILAATGLQRPDAGTVHVCGIDLWAHRTSAQRLLGVVPDRLRTFDRLTGRQLLVHTALLRRVKRAEALARSASLLTAFGLDDDADRVVADYSIGMQKAIAIAAALVHNPRVIVLDEPFESMDPASTDRIVEVLRGYRQRGGTVVLSSHDMGLVERTCDSVAVVQHGKLLAVGSMEQVRAGQSLEARFRQLVGAQQEDLAWLSPSQA